MEMATIYGAITLHEDYPYSIKFIKSLEKDIMWPQINTSDFGLGDYNDYYYDNMLLYDYSWNNMIISFAKTMSAAIVEANELNLFMLKFEHILKNIDFVTATLHIEALFESANLFWAKKSYNSRLNEEAYFIESNDWYFSFGYRSVSGHLIESKDYIEEQSKLYTYPAKFLTDSISTFLNFYNRNIKSEVTTLSYILQETQLSHEVVRDIVSYLAFKKIVLPFLGENGLESFRVLKNDPLSIDNFYN